MCELTQKREVAARDISANLQIVNSLTPLIRKSSRLPGQSAF